MDRQDQGGSLACAEREVELDEQDDHDECGSEAATAGERSFIDTLFSGSRFVFWALAPLSVFAALTFVCTIDNLWSVAGASRLLVGACGLLFALALANPHRFGGAARGVTAIVFLFCVLYLADEWLAHRRGAPQATRPGTASLANAIYAFLFFGLPSLWFTVRPRRLQPTAGA